MARMRKRRSDPILMGEPSPGLSKINKMNMEQLTHRIETLEAESAHLSRKIENLSNIQPRDEKRIELLTTQRTRLAALMQAAQDRLRGKADRREQRASSGYRSARH